jgi:hypothetical protein
MFPRAPRGATEPARVSPLRGFRADEGVANPGLRLAARGSPLATVYRSSGAKTAQMNGLQVPAYRRWAQPALLLNVASGPASRSTTA